MDVPARPSRVAPAEFLAVYRAHSVFVWHALRLCGVPDSALEDAAQDVFVVVHRRLHEFEGRAKVRTWIFEIARRVAARHRDRVRRHASRLEELPELAGPDDPDAALDRTLAADILREFVGTLDEDRLRVFILAEFGQLRGREIAETLDVNLNTVYARLRSAHKELDRLTARLRAREARALLKAARDRRPSKASRRRAWAALAVQLGLPKAGAGGVAAGVAVGIGGKWLGLGVVVAGALGVAALQQPATVPVEVPAVTQAGADASPPNRVAAVAKVAAVDRPRASAAMSVSSPVAVPVPTATTSAATAPARAPASPPAPARTPPASPAVSAAELAAEVALVKELRRSIGKDGAFSATLATYRRNHADGELRPEVDALVIEHDCRRGHAGDAEAAVEDYARRFPGSSLTRRLRSACGLKKGPQQPAGRGTQGT